MNNWKDPTDMTRAELVAEALTGNPQPLRDSVDRELADTNDDPQAIREAAGRDEPNRVLRAGLMIAARMADVELQAARDAGRDARPRWDLEQKAAEHQLVDMVNGDPHRWWARATPAQICDAYLTAKTTRGDIAMEAEQILATGLKDRYGIDVCDLDPEQVDPRDAAAQEAGWQRFAAQIERDMSVRWPDVAQAHGWPESAARREGLADRLDATSPPGAAAADQVLAAADDAIGLFLEYRDQHGYDEDVARLHALGEVSDGITGDILQGADTTRRDDVDAQLAGDPPSAAVRESAINAVGFEDADGVDLVDVGVVDRVLAEGTSALDRLRAEREQSGRAIEAAAPDRCSICDGRGVVLSPAWREWYDREDEARKTWGANHRIGSCWSDTAEAKALAAALPDEPEEITCTDCDGATVEPVDAMASMSLALRAALEGDHETAADHFDRARQATAAKTGRDDEAIEEDIRALLERTPRDNDITRRAQAEAETRESSQKAAAPESGVEPMRRAADQASDARVAAADVDAVGDDNPSPVERAQRAVLELKGRRALEEQYAQARNEDAVSHGHHRDGEPRSTAAPTDRGPVLSAFDD